MADLGNVLNRYKAFRTQLADQLSRCMHQDGAAVVPVITWNRRGDKKFAPTLSLPESLPEDRRMLYSILEKVMPFVFSAVFMEERARRQNRKKRGRKRCVWKIRATQRSIELRKLPNPPTWKEISDIIFHEMGRRYSPSTLESNVKEAKAKRGKKRIVNSPPSTPVVNHQ